MSSLTFYSIISIAALLTFLMVLISMYKKKSTRLARDLNVAYANIHQLQTELKHAQIKHKIEADNAQLTDSELIERMREKGYFRPD